MFNSEIMEKKKEENACVFYITGGNNQIMPNVTKVVQNFYVDRSEMDAMKEHGMESVKKREPVPVETKSYDQKADDLKLAEGELRIYYTDDVSLNAFIIRVGACKDASDLANLVVGEMMEHTIMNGGIVVKAHFIEALLAFVHFTKGSSVNNIRQHIRKFMDMFGIKKGGKDSNHEK